MADDTWCRSCGDPIEWRLTTDGARMPLDVKPSSHGNVFITASGHARVLTAEEAERGRKAGAILRVSHHATCPKAERHRVPRAQESLGI